MSALTEGTRLLVAEARVAELERQLAKCGGANCMGHQVDGCIRWVREERLTEVVRQRDTLLEACRAVLRVADRATVEFDTLRAEIAMCEKEGG